MRIVIAGAVSSTLQTLKKLVEHDMNIVGVLGYEPYSRKNVSGYSWLKPEAEKNDLMYMAFKNINDLKVIEQLKKWSPDLLFVVGLSQLVDDVLMQIPKKCVIGFHPTELPKGRGRAPIAWSILKEKKVGANFFIIDSGVDSGPILDQELIMIEDVDYAEDIELKILNAIHISLDRLLPKIKKGNLDVKVQNEKIASYYGKRAPSDGCIDWRNSALKIFNLIRASSFPHPGAFTFKDNFRIVIWKARVEEKINYTGVIGRILVIDEQGNVLIQTGSGLLWLTKFEIYDYENKVSNTTLKVGQRLGFYSDLEIYKLKNELNELKNNLK